MCLVWGSECSESVGCGCMGLESSGCRLADAVDDYGAFGVREIEGSVFTDRWYREYVYPWEYFAGKRRERLYGVVVLGYGNGLKFGGWEGNGLKFRGWKGTGRWMGCGDENGQEIGGLV